MKRDEELKMIELERPEMIFLPYKASMWDSLESIWRAAVQEGQYNCRVIAIPYYEKNPDGSLGKMYYEGGELPDYVPVENWESYDIEKRRPKVAFIHNPYDDINTVTAVHPKYYALELKDKVDILVYCPYFLSKNTVNRHFCITPGVAYSDYTFLQSEKIREQYLTYWDEYEKANNINGGLGNFREKIIAIGSPKMDRVRFFDKEKELLPSEWMNLIRGRKIVLYNTHLDDVMRFKGEFLKKLLWVFDVFRHNDKNVLWWRPHPLMEQTIKSTCPEYLELYRKIVNIYKMEGLGIYDDTPDVHRAIGYADLYYGSGGSLVPMFAATGKPMLRHEILFHESDTVCVDHDKIEYTFCVRCKDTYYVGVKDTNLMISKKENEEHWQIECHMPPLFNNYLLSGYKAFSDGNIIHIFCLFSYDYVKYDTSDKKISIVKLSENEQAYMDGDNSYFGRIQLSGVHEYRDDFVITPFIHDAIIIMKKQNGHMVYRAKWKERLRNIMAQSENELINIRGYGTCIIGNILYMIAHGRTYDTICSINLEKMDELVVYNPMGYGCLSYMEPTEEGIWLRWYTEDNGSIILWEPHSNTVKKNIEFKTTNSQYTGGYRLKFTDQGLLVVPNITEIHTWEYPYSWEQLSITDDISISDINDERLKNQQEILMKYGNVMEEQFGLALPHVLEIIDSMPEDRTYKYSYNYDDFCIIEDESAGNLIYQKVKELHNKRR